ncbi:thioredoxin family protein [Mycoplasmopsis agassizii]|uniref:thioredoxin family protein n=1 Tax=Mycoplasmopsis agassizii TaxID=33922 RepID=UPI003529B4D4
MSQDLLQWDWEKWEDVEHQIDKGLVFLEIVTDWCGDCKMMAPTVAKLRAKYIDDQRIKFIKVNAEQANLYKNEKAKFHVKRIPTHLLLQDGKVLNEHIEYCSLDMLDGWVQAALK